MVLVKEREQTNRMDRVLVARFSVLCVVPSLPPLISLLFHLLCFTFFRSLLSVCVAADSAGRHKVLHQLSQQRLALLSEQAGGILRTLWSFSISECVCVNECVVSNRKLHHI